MKFPAEQFRWSDAPHGYRSETGNPFGLFIIPARSAHGRILACLACDGLETGWDHVSVSIEQKEKCPSWPEMCVVKDLFWNEEDAVIQFHPPESDYVNFHGGCLHLWKRSQGEFPLPPSILVGPKDSR